MLSYEINRPIIIINFRVVNLATFTTKNIIVQSIMKKMALICLFLRTKVYKKILGTGYGQFCRCYVTL